MINFKIQDQRGVAHLGLIVGVVVVLSAVGFAGWRVMQKDKESKNSVTTSGGEASPLKCDIDDKDICKFYSSWKNNKFYRIEGTTTSEGKTSTSTFEIAGEDRSRIVFTGEGGMEMITIGNTTYTKDPSDGKWWKQTYDKPEESKSNDVKKEFEFDEPKKETAPDKTTYKKLGKEPCGKLSCFKYQVIDPEAKDQTELIWFDDKDYQLRRTTSEGPDGKSDMTFTYDKFEIKEPSPVKDMPVNQPTAAPSEAELQRMMQEYSQ